MKVESEKEKKEKRVVRKRQLVLWGRVRPLAEPVAGSYGVRPRKNGGINPPLQRAKYGGQGCGERQSLLRAHEEKRLVGEAGVLRAEALRVVLLFYINEFF